MNFCAADVSPTLPRETIVDDVHQNIQALLKADAASISPSPNPVRVEIPKLPSTQPVVVKKPAPLVATTRPTTRPAVVAVKPKPSTQPAVDPELEKLRNAKLTDPLAVADSFFKAGKLAEATILYEQALAKAKPADKDWMLLQLGACKEPSDPQAALTWYGRLLSECPNSPWLSVAKARQGVLHWLIDQDVPTLLKNAVPGKTK